MAEISALLAIIAKNGEVVIGGLVGAVGYLCRRSIKMLDRSIKELEESIHGTHESSGLKSELSVITERVNKQEQRRQAVDEQLDQIYKLVDGLNQKITDESIKNAEKIGEVKGDVGKCVAMLELLVNNRD